MKEYYICKLYCIHICECDLCSQRSDESATGTGFTATYVTSCGGRVVVGNEVGVISSPNYPAPYNPSSNCTWVLVGTQAG